MGKALQLSGMRFGRLTVIRFLDCNKRKCRRWKCACDCGSETIAIGSELVNGKHSSCGCARSEKLSQICKSRNLIHGLAYSPIWVSWAAMRNRCYFKGDINYKNYGGRGIKVCDWLYSSVTNLKELIGERLIGMSLDRIKTDIHYSCGKCPECIKNKWNLNVRWATRNQQARNRRNTLILDFKGQSKSVSDWADIVGIPRSTIFIRVKKLGWSHEMALTKHVQIRA